MLEGGIFSGALCTIVLLQNMVIRLFIIRTTYLHEKVVPFTPQILRMPYFIVCLRVSSSDCLPSTLNFSCSAYLLHTSSKPNATVHSRSTFRSLKAAVSSL